MNTANPSDDRLELSLRRVAAQALPSVAHLVDAHVMAMTAAGCDVRLDAVNVCPSRNPFRIQSRRVAVLAMAAMVATTGAAFANALPESMQRALASIARPAGVHLPLPATPVLTHVASDAFGDSVSVVAHQSLRGRAHGAAVSAVASSRGVARRTAHRSTNATHRTNMHHGRASGTSRAGRIFTPAHLLHTTHPAWHAAPAHPVHAARSAASSHASPTAHGAATPKMSHQPSKPSTPRETP